jgi:hypothetical protein
MLLHRLTRFRKSVHDNRHLQSYREVLLQTECEPIETTIRTRRLQLLGELVRQGDDRTPKQMLFAELDHGGRTRGRPVDDWVSVVKGDLKEFNIEPSTWFETAKDGPEWNKLVAKQALYFTATWHTEEEKKQTERHNKDAAAAVAAAAITAETATATDTTTTTTTAAGATSTAADTTQATASTSTLTSSS